MNRLQLRDFFSLVDEELFRADQVIKWVYHYYCDDFDHMINFRKSLRNKLKQFFEICAPSIIHKYHSYDGTMKFCFQIDNQQIETVYILKDNRATLCISSEIGYALQCIFCFTE